MITCIVIDVTKKSDMKLIYEINSSQFFFKWHTYSFWIPFGACCYPFVLLLSLQDREVQRDALVKVMSEQLQRMEGTCKETLGTDNPWSRKDKNSGVRWGQHLVDDVDYIDGWFAFDVSFGWKN